MNARIVGLGAIAGGLAWATACSGQSGTEKDGGHDGLCPEFSIEPVLDAASGDFAGTSLTLEVLPGAPSCVDEAWLVSLALTVGGPDLDERLAAELSLRGPSEPVVAEASAPTDEPIPGMEGLSDLRHDWVFTFEDPRWTAALGWSGRTADGEASGTLGIWVLEPVGVGEERR